MSNYYIYPWMIDSTGEEHLIPAYLQLSPLGPYALYEDAEAAADARFQEMSDGCCIVWSIEREEKSEA